MRPEPGCEDQAAHRENRFLRNDIGYDKGFEAGYLVLQPQLSFLQPLNLQAIDDRRFFQALDNVVHIAMLAAYLVEPCPQRCLNVDLRFVRHFPFNLPAVYRTRAWPRRRSDRHATPPAIRFPAHRLKLIGFNTIRQEAVNTSHPATPKNPGPGIVRPGS